MRYLIAVAVLVSMTFTGVAEAKTRRRSHKRTHVARKHTTHKRHKLAQAPRHQSPEL